MIRSFITLAFIIAVLAGCAKPPQPEPLPLADEGAASPVSSPATAEATTEYSGEETTGNAESRKSWFPLFNTWDEGTAARVQHDCEQRALLLVKQSQAKTVHNTSSACRCVTLTMKQLTLGQIKNPGKDDNFSYAFGKCTASSRVPGVLHTSEPQEAQRQQPSESAVKESKPYFDPVTKTWRKQ